MMGNGVVYFLFLFGCPKTNFSRNSGQESRTYIYIIIINNIITIMSIVNHGGRLFKVKALKSDGTWFFDFTVSLDVRVYVHLVL